MKKKITRFLLMTSFLISAISCSVDEQEPSASNLHTPVSVRPNDTRFHQYTALEQMELRRNLIGSYRSPQIQTLLIVRRNEFQYRHIEGQLAPVNWPYTIVFNRLARPTIVVRGGNMNMSYRIICDNNNPTRVIRLSSIRNFVQYDKL